MRDTFIWQTINLVGRSKHISKWVLNKFSCLDNPSFSKKSVAWLLDVGPGLFWKIAVIWFENKQDQVRYGPLVAAITFLAADKAVVFTGRFVHSIHKFHNTRAWEGVSARRDGYPRFEGSILCRLYLTDMMYLLIIDFTKKLSE